MDQTLAVGLSQGAVYAFLAMGFVIGYLATLSINIAHGVFAVLAIFVAASLAPSVGVVFAMAIAVLVTALCGVLVERSLLRLAADAPPLVQALLTIGLALAMSGGIRLIWGTDERSLPSPVGVTSVAVGGVVLNPMSYVVVAALGLTLASWWLMSHRTLVGKTLLACAQDIDGARICGVPVSRFRMVAFGAAVCTAALVGVMSAPLTFVTYESGIGYSLRALIAAALGGFKSVPAAVCSGLLIGLIEAFTVAYVSSQLKTAVTFTILLALLAIRPGGLLRTQSVTV